MPDSIRAFALWFRTAFRGAPGLTLLQCAIAGLIALLAPLQTYGVKLIIDGVSGQRSHLTPGAILLVSCFTVLTLAAQIGYPLQSQVNERIYGRLHVDVLRLTTTIPGIALHEQPEVADRLQQLGRDAEGMSYSATALLSIISATVNTALVLGLLASVHPLLLLLPVLGLVRVWAAAVTGNRRWRAINETRPHARLFHKLVAIGNSPQHGLELRVFGLREVLCERMWRLLRELSARQLPTNRRAALVESIARVGFGIGYIAGVVFVVVRARHGRSSPGDVALLVLLSGRVDQAASGIATNVRNLATMLGQFRGYIWLLDYAKSQKWSGTEPAPAILRHGITFHGVQFRYPGAEVPALSDVDIEFPAGATIALVGENGAGKSTLVKLLARLYDPSDGAILVEGVDLRTIDPLLWRERISAGFQDFNRYEFLARESIGVGDLSHVDDPVALAGALQRGDAYSVVDQLPEGLETQLGKQFDGAELSGGQWQRVALARSFMRARPLVLLLDEPTAALDPEAEHALFDRFRAATSRARATGGITVLVSHRFSTVRMADLIVVVADGRIDAVGTHEELVSAGGRYAELFELQARAYR